MGEVGVVVVSSERRGVGCVGSRTSAVVRGSSCDVFPLPHVGGRRRHPGGLRGRYGYPLQPLGRPPLLVRPLLLVVSVGSPLYVAEPSPSSLRSLWLDGNAVLVVERGRGAGRAVCSDAHHRDRQGRRGSRWRLARVRTLLCGATRGQPPPHLSPLPGPAVGHVPQRRRQSAQPLSPSLRFHPHLFLAQLTRLCAAGAVCVVCVRGGRHRRTLSASVSFAVVGGVDVALVSVGGCADAQLVHRLHRCGRCGQLGAVRRLPPAADGRSGAGDGSQRRRRSRCSRHLRQLSEPLLTAIATIQAWQASGAVLASNQDVC